MKKCKQCGRTLELDCFADYVSRSNGSRSSAPGKHTICRECELFNANINYLYRKNRRTEEERTKLLKAEQFYRALHKRGLEPKGRFARDKLGLEPFKVRRVTTDYEEFMKAVLDSGEASKEQDTELAIDVTIERRLLRLAEVKLVDHPDEYFDQFNEIRKLIDKESGIQNGPVPVKYIDLYEAVSNRLDLYEEIFEDAL